MTLQFDSVTPIPLPCNLDLWPFDLEHLSCSLSAVTWSNYVPNFSEIVQSAAEFTHFHVTCWYAVARVSVLGAICDSATPPATKFWPMAPAYCMTSWHRHVPCDHGACAAWCVFWLSQFNTWVGAIIETCFSLVVSDVTAHDVNRHAWMMT